jgi:probable selenium-dependent hydroxylase accessory protein YqeC
LARLSAWFEEFIFGSQKNPIDHRRAGMAGPESNSGARGKAGPTVVTFIGSGGKTSLIWLLARSLAQGGSSQLRETDLNGETIRASPSMRAEETKGQAVRRKVLVTPAAKMYIPGGEGFFDRYCNGIPAGPAAGVSLAGRFNEKSGKLESLPLEALEGIIGDYDVVLIEGDGSRELPLKGWAEYEPVVPRFTCITAGLIPIKPLGMPVTEKIIHRLPQFCALTGAKQGDILAPEHLAAVIEGPAEPGSGIRSLFSAARGRKLLFFNQAENAEELDQCFEVVRLLTPEFRLAVCKITAGSVKKNIVEEIHGQDF